MNGITAIILDDEIKPAEALKSKIEKFHPEVKVLALCHDVATGLEKIVLLKPQLLFLDIEMPHKNGIEFLELIRAAGIHLAVIITSAHSKAEYFRKAFHLAAVDYLVKPVLPEELKESIQKVQKQLQEKEPVKTLEQLIPALQDSAPQGFPCAMGKLFLKNDQLVYIKAEGNYSRFFLTDGKSELITESLKELEKKFSNSSIVRVDRSHFINRLYIQKITTHNNRCYFSTHLGIPHIELSDTGIKMLMN